MSVSLSVSSRSCLAPQTATVAHVLRLVGSSYLDANAAAAGPSRSRTYHGHRRSSLLPQTITSVPLSGRTSRRFASSAHALSDRSRGAGVDDGTHEHSSHHSRGHDNGSIHAHGHTHDHAHPYSDLPVVLTPKSRTWYEPLRREPMPKWAALPQATQNALFGSAPRPTIATFKELYRTAGLDPMKLLPARRLTAVATIWCTPNTSRGDWEWLLELLNEAKARGPPWDELTGSESLFRLLRGVAFARGQYDWETARANVAVGIKAALAAAPSPDFFPARDLDVLAVYIELCRDAKRIDDVGIVVKYAGQQLHKRLCQISGTTMGGGPDARRLRKLMHGALNEMRNPFGWLEKQQVVKGRDGGFSRANYHLAVTLLAALVADKSRVADAFLFWRNLVQHFNSTSIPPSVASVLAGNLARDGHFEAAKQVFASLHEKHAALPHSALSRELWAFADHGELEQAQRVWELITARYAPTAMDRRAFATAYAAKGDLEGAREALRSLFGPDIHSHIDALIILQRACVAANNTEGALTYLNLATELKPTLQLFESLLFLYAKMANVDGAVNVFQRMLAADLSPSLEAYTSLISAFANKADYVNASYVFQAMQDAGYTPNDIAWSAVLNSVIESGEWIVAAELCERIPPALMRSKALATTVLKAYVYIKAPHDKIMQLFRSIRSPPEHAWALAIIAASDVGNMVLARSLFEEMDARAKLDPLCPPPNVYVYSILLAMYLRIGDRESAHAVYDTMIFRGALPTSVTYSIITQSYAEAPGESSADQAHKFAMSVYDSVIASEPPHARGAASENVFGPLLIAAGRSGDIESAKRYYDFIRSTGCNSVTLTTKLMAAYRRGGHLKEVYRLWLRLFRHAVRTIPRRDPKRDGPLSTTITRSQNNILCVPMSITIKAFAEAGLHDRLKQVWRSVRTAGFGFDSQNYNHMAVALARTGDVVGAFHIVDRVLIPRRDEVRARYDQAMRTTTSMRVPETDVTLADIPDAEFDAMGDWIDATAEAAASEAQGEVGPEGQADEPVEPEPVGTTGDMAETGPQRRNVRRYLPEAVTRSRDAYDDANEREHEHGREHDGDEVEDGPNEFRPDLDLLRLWRPSDILWRPSRATLDVLQHAYTQLEDQRAYHAWIGMSTGGSDDADAEGEDGVGAAAAEQEPPVITLPEFGNVTVKNKDGTPKHMSPKVLLMRINRKYARAVGLVTFYRHKMRAREAQRRAGGY